MHSFTSSFSIIYKVNIEGECWAIILDQHNKKNIYI